MDSPTKLDSYVGTLAHRKTTVARRRNTDDEDSYIVGMDPFLVDAEMKVASSKAVRRLLDKTQVLTNPANQHIRRRITHSAEVTSLATFMASVLGLNVELTRAIALAHDIGHPPFGHDGEAFLNSVGGPNRVFKHEVMGVVIAQHIERHGQGLNLTKAVLEGIMRDAWVIGKPKSSPDICDHEAMHPLSEEAKVVMWGDRFAYMTGDYNDFLRIGYAVPKEIIDIMDSYGDDQRARTRRLMKSLIEESAEEGKVCFEKSYMAHTFRALRAEMYNVYPRLNASNGREILSRLYEFVSKAVPDVDPVLTIALMTDQDAVFLASQPVLDYSRFAQTTVAEIISSLRGRAIEWWNPDLEW